MINLPFTYSYTIIQNVLTIIFDFSSMSYTDYSSVKRDYFQQGLVLNESGFDMNFQLDRRIQTYKINIERFVPNGDARLKRLPFSGVVNLRLMGRKVREYNKEVHPVGSSGYFDGEYRIRLSA